MAAKTHVSNLITDRAEPPVEVEYRFYPEGSLRDFVENPVCIIRIIIGTNTGMVSSEHVVGAAEVCPEACMEYCLSRSSITHIPKAACG
jgi:hypothetical protein